MRGVLLTTLFCGALAGSLLAAVAARADGQPPVAAAPAPADASGIWSAADYLAWSVSGDKLPALVTTSPPGTPQAQAGVLGDGTEPHEPGAIK